MPSVAIDLDGALGDTMPLWRAWLDEAARTLPIPVESLPRDRAEAADALDRAGAGNWRALLERFAADRAPVYLRPSAVASAALRRLELAGVRIGLYTDAPAELAELAAAQLGVLRRAEALEAGAGALEHLLVRLGAETTVIQTKEDLVRASTYSMGNGKS